MRAKRRILILDDETKVAFFLRESLEALGHNFEVVSVSSSDEALAEASREKFDLLVTDQRLPSMNGLDLIEQVQELHPDTPFILITAYSSEDVLAKAQRLGAYRYFIKPFRIDDFVQSVVDALENGDGRPREPLLDRPADVLSDRLEELRREMGAQCVLASNMEGALLAQAGSLFELDAEQLLNSAAKDFSTSLAMSQFLGGAQGGHLAYYEGATHDIYLSNVKDDLFVAIVFDRRMQASRIGIVWLYARRAIENLRRVWPSIPLELAVE